MSFKGTILKIIDINNLCKMNHFVYQSIKGQSMLVDTDMDYSVMMFVSGGKATFEIENKIFTLDNEKKVIILPRHSNVELAFSDDAEIVTYSFNDYLDLSTETIASLQLIGREEYDDIHMLSVNAYANLLLMEIKAMTADKEMSEVMHRIYFLKVIKLLEKYHGSRIFASFLSPTISGRYKSVEKYHKKLLAAQKNTRNKPKLDL